MATNDHVTRVSQQPLYSSSAVRTTRVSQQPLYSNSAVRTTRISQQPLYSNSAVRVTGVRVQFVVIPTSWVPVQITLRGVKLVRAGGKSEVCTEVESCESVERAL